MTSIETSSPTGSNWNIWDLHVHSPASFGGEDYDTFIQNLTSAEASVVGINDYCSLEGYKILQEKGGVPGKVIFPVIELRMHNIIANRRSDTIAQGGPKINFHLIFNNDQNLFGSIETWFNSLNCFVNIGELQLGTVPKDQLSKVTFEFFSVLKKLNEVGLREHCLVWLPYDEYGGIDEIDHDDNFFKLSLIRNADVLGSSREKQIDFFKWKDPRFSEDYYRQYMDIPKPCIKGSDAHEMRYPFGRLKNHKSEPIEKFCWIKANLTFNGLKQIIYEPDRVYIGKEPELLQRKKAHPHKFFKSLLIDKEASAKTNEHWFQSVEIPFNSGLIAIIGKKGNGKSAIADIVGLCANAKNNKDDLSFLHKDKFRNPRSNKSKEFKGVLTWEDGNSSGEINLNSEINIRQEERAKYIPQNYLEKLCVNEEQKEFEQELKKIIFSHLPIAERLGQNSLDDLIELKQKAIEEGIGKLKLEITRSNKVIERLESKAKEAYKTSINQEISNKEAEISHHDQNKPLEKVKPDEDETQIAANSAVLLQIESKQTLLRQLSDQRKKLDTSSSCMGCGGCSKKRRKSLYRGTGI